MAAGCRDLGGDLLGAIEPAMCMHEDVVSLTRELGADRRADRPTAPGDERAFHGGTTAFSSTVARPLTSVCVPLLTENTYIARSLSPMRRLASIVRSPG